MLVEAGDHNGDRSASEGGVRLDGLVGKPEIPTPPLELLLGGDPCSHSGSP